MPTRATVQVDDSRSCLGARSAQAEKRKDEHDHDDQTGKINQAIFEGCEILLHRKARRLRITVLVVTAWDRALLVGVCDNQARIDRKAFAANQTGRNALSTTRSNT